MRQLVRVMLALLGAMLMVGAAGFAMQADWATSTWPWPDGRLTYLFVGSILAAIGAPILWIAWRGELAAMRAGALDLSLTYAGAAATLAWLGLPTDRALAGLLIGFALLSAIANALLFGLSLRLRFRDRRLIPWLVRLSFALFAGLLLGVGLALVLRAPHVFPWPLKPETSVVVGWIFFGASVYFIHALKEPYWGNAQGQLVGFLAYDLVLIGPFVSHLSTVAPGHRLSLWIYLGVIVYSAGLAIYFLFLHPATRLWQSAEAGT